ncbi:PREDICTED: GDSL esterase/lipase At5g37690-like [Ipomoea nil]|uniref:GDSL esterase/lipase At5g37690-like n=1 Tax=Ipomoea nil TaxID=35883 RepID=UPI000901F9FE|nr:PREDICTED: GDSL esterase/lipase At5g37690-like [Ipomoea nil]
MAILQRVFFPLLIVVAIPAAVAAAASAPVTYVFGDSLTEVGNNNFLQSLAKSNYPFYGIDYFGGMATGRFTNGRTVGDIISEKMGIPSPPPYLALLPNDEAYVTGVNYASGGAGILNDTGLYFVQRLTFDDQISYFEKTKEAIKARLGDEAAEKHCNEALYFVGIGSNDYVNNFLQPFLAKGILYTHDQFLELLTSTLNQQFMRLYHLGARKILYHSLGPLGCIPSQRVKSQTGECLYQVNVYVQEFNSRVKNMITTLNTQLPYAKMTFADTYHDVLDLIENPSAYGFKYSNTSCCNVDTSVGGLCLPNSKLCLNRSEYVFWDAYHPSEAANLVLAGKIFTYLDEAHNRSSHAPKPSHRRLLSNGRSIQKVM